MNIIRVDFRGRLGREFTQPAEQSVDDDEVGVETVDAGGENEIEAQAAGDAMPVAHSGVGNDPEEKFEKVWAGDGWDAMPSD